MRRGFDLLHYMIAINELATRRGDHFIGILDIASLATPPGPQTRDGMHLNAVGHWRAARTVAGRLTSYERWKSLDLTLGKSEVSVADAERLRQFILEKNRLWFDYWRPQNWAFLHGDRTEQASSRDHRDPKKRWFPEEMEKFLPLIEAKEREIWKLAAELK